MTSRAESLNLLGEREDLEPYGEHAFALLAVECRFALSDIASLAPSILTDGDRDKKCDLLYVSREQRTAIICQAYWAQVEKQNASSNKASDLTTAASWILAPQNPAGLGPELAAARDDLVDALTHDDLDDIEFWFCHNLSSSKMVQDELDQVAMTAKHILGTAFPGKDMNVRGVEVTPERVDEWLRRNDRRVVIHDTLTIPTNQWLEESGDGWNGVYTSVSAEWLHSLYEKYGSERLFAGNIRGDMKPRRSAGDINNGIQQTVLHDPARLWAYNNGVTALVEEIKTGTALSVRGISIVNGAQTTGSIGRLRELDTDAKSAKVLIRFVESSDEQVIRDISTYNNTQNEILPSDFRSSDPVQERLVKDFQASKAATYWGPRRGGSGKGAKRPKGLLDADLVAQALAAFHGAPDIAYHAKNQIWRDNTIYARFFNEHTSAPHVIFCVGLVKAVRRLKIEYRAQSVRTSLQEQVFDFLSHRGSDFLLTWGIARCIEEILNRPIVDKWVLSFGEPVSLDVADDYWLPVVKALANYVDQLKPAAASGNLRDDETVNTASAAFQSRVATGREGVAALDRFSALVIT